ATVIGGGSPCSCPTTDIVRAKSREESFGNGVSSTSTCPDVGLLAPYMQRNSVVLPEPLGPTKPVITWLGICREILCKIVRKLKLSTVIMIVRSPFVSRPAKMVRRLRR